MEALRDDASSFDLEQPSDGTVEEGCIGAGTAPTNHLSGFRDSIVFNVESGSDKNRSFRKAAMNLYDDHKLSTLGTGEMLHHILACFNSCNGKWERYEHAILDASTNEPRRIFGPLKPRHFPNPNPFPRVQNAKSTLERVVCDRFIRAIRSHLWFYVKWMIPFICEMEEKEYPNVIDNCRSASDHFLYAVWLLWHGHMPDRYTAGLLRKEQVTIVQEAMDCLRYTILGLFQGYTTGICHATFCGKLELACYQGFNMISFFSGWKFRSERLELLLVKHLTEGDLNLPLIEALDTINTARGELLREEAMLPAGIKRLTTWFPVSQLAIP